MLALEITSLKTFMGQLLTGDVFDHFLLCEATVSTAFTYTIDGHRNLPFYTEEEQNDGTHPLEKYAVWSEIKPLLYHLIKGTHTPLYFKFVLQLSAENTARLLIRNECSVPPEQIRGLLLTVKYENGKALLTTGISYDTFVMSKEPDEIWDRALMTFLTKKEVGFERL